MISSIIGSINLRSLDLSGIEMGINFLKAFRMAMNEDPKLIDELTLEDLKNSAHIHSLINILCMSTTLQYLNLSNNVINLMAGEELS